MLHKSNYSYYTRICSLILCPVVLRIDTVGFKTTIVVDATAMVGDQISAVVCLITTVGYETYVVI